MPTLRNSKKNDRFSHKTGLVFVHGDVFKDRSRNSATFKMELNVIIGNGRVYNQWAMYLHVAAVTQPSLQAKLKSDENGHALKAASDTISCFVDMFLHFFENTN